MSARVRSIRTNITKNKNTKYFSKTITSNFKISSPKSPKNNKEFLLTRSTRFSDNNLTNTLASSIRTISKNKFRKKEKPLCLNFDDLHKQFLLYKNNENNIISSIYKNNNYNKNNIKYLSNIHSRNNNVMKLKKKSTRQSFFFSLDEPKSRNNYYNNQYQTYSNVASSILNNIYDNKSKILYRRNNNITINSNSNYSEEYFNNNNIYNCLIFSPKQLKEKDPNFKLNKKKSTKIKNTKFIINSENNKCLRNNNSKDINDEMHLTDGNNKISQFYYRNLNRMSLNEQLAYPTFNSFLFSASQRKENKLQFLYKTRIMILDKYLKNINKNNYYKQLTANENNIENEVLKKRNLELTKKMLSSYNRTLDEYILFLNKKLRKMREENEMLEDRKAEYNKDIEKIKLKIRKDMNKIKEAFSIKYFLICVKNHTIFTEKFREEDIEEIENDKKKLKEDYYLTSHKNPRKEYKTKKSSKLLNSPIKKVIRYSSDKEVNFKNNVLIDANKVNVKNYNSCVSISNKKPKRVSITVMSSVEEFFEHFEAIASNLNNLIKLSNDIYSNNIYLKLELDKCIINNTLLKSTEHNEVNSQIALFEQKLDILKTKHQKILNQYNQLKDNKFKNEIKIKLVMKSLYIIYNNIKNKYNISSINEDDLINFGDKIYLKKIEDFFFKMMDKVSKDKIKYPLDYEIIRQQIDKRKKKEAFFTFQRLLAEKIQIIIDTVIKKASKVIYRRMRKTNDYREYYKNFNTIQKVENRKNDIELFFELIDNNDND